MLLVTTATTNIYWKFKCTEWEKERETRTDELSAFFFRQKARQRAAAMYFYFRRWHTPNANVTFANRAKRTHRLISIYTQFDTTLFYMALMAIQWKLSSGNVCSCQVKLGHSMRIEFRSGCVWF